MFKNNTNVADRFYFLGDWVDEYCDLTLDKMVEQYKEKKTYSPTIETTIPQNSKELVELLNTYKIDEKKKDNHIVLSNNEVVPINAYKFDASNKKAGFFSKVKSIFKK